LAAWLLTACQTIPDLSAWDRSTRDVGTAVIDGFYSTAGVNADLAARLRRIDDPALLDRATQYAAASKVVSDRAEDYETLFGAMADYSASLAAIAKASANSDENVEAVAGSVNQFIGALGGTPLVGAGFELGKLLASEIIKVRAARDFASAVQAADPIVGSVCDLLLKDLASAKAVLATKEEPIRTAISLPFEDRLKYRTLLEKRRTTLQTTVRNNSPDTSLSQVPEASEIQKVDVLLRDTDTWYVPLAKDIDQALITLSRTEQLIVQTSRAVGAWRASHASLAVAIQQKRAPESAKLAALAVRIRDLAAEIRKGN
jgi:hypothetical protein